MMAKGVTIRDWQNNDHRFADATEDQQQVDPTRAQDVAETDAVREWESMRWANMTPGTFLRETLTNLGNISKDIRKGNVDIQTILVKERRLRSCAALLLVIAIVVYVTSP